MSTVTRPRIGACLLAVTVAIATLACGGSAQARAAPVGPNALEVTASSETSLSLRWKDRSRSEAYYKVRVSGRVRRLAANRQTVTVTRLRPNVAYRVVVQACARAGRCSKAATGIATTVSPRSAPAPSSSQPGSGTTTEPVPSGLPPAPPTAQTATVEVTGTVTVTTGNSMPTIGGPSGNNPCLRTPVAGARVLLYAPELTYGAESPGTFYRGPRSPNAQATADAAGRYRLAVEPGTYSFLVDAGEGPECGVSDANRFACPHPLLAPTQTVDLNVDHAVW
jgi:hypothetical protein